MSLFLEKINLYFLMRFERKKNEKSETQHVNADTNGEMKFDYILMKSQSKMIIENVTLPAGNATYSQKITTY